MELMKKALAALHAAEARFHELLNPVEHLAERTRDLAKATAQTVEASVPSLSQRLAKIEAALAEVVHAPAIEADVGHLFEKPSVVAPATAPAAPVTQDAEPAAGVSNEAKTEPSPSGS